MAFHRIGWEFSCGFRTAPWKDQEDFLIYKQRTSVAGPAHVSAFLHAPPGISAFPPAAPLLSQQKEWEIQAVCKEQRNGERRSTDIKPSLEVPNTSMSSIQPANEPLKELKGHPESSS